MTPNKRDLKAYARFDGMGRIVPGSLVLRRKKPKVGNWTEVQTYECCDGGGETVCSEVVIPINLGYSSSSICSVVGSFPYEIYACNSNFQLSSPIGEVILDGYYGDGSSGFYVENSIIINNVACA